jgi:phytoene synthase
VSAPAQAPTVPPGAEAILARAGGENFPVASRVLPAHVRADLLAIYGFARLADELGDSAPGDRLAALDWLQDELDRAFAGSAAHPLLVRLQHALRRRSLPREPFLRLIEANRTDQRVSRYETWEQLRAYCALSADPVGELVLHVLDAATPPLIALSDRICTALQLIEHCQDVAEDYAAGRIYLPAEDLRRFGCAPEMLAPVDPAHAGPLPAPLRDVLEFEARRAGALLGEGRPLVRALSGRARVAVAAFLAGGRAALDAIERNGYEVRDGPPPASRPRFAAALGRELAASVIGRRDRPAAMAPATGGEPAGGGGPATDITPAVRAAYRRCEAITRSRAANFYYGIRLLPAPKRRAMCAVYAFARRVDDIGDGTLAQQQKLLRLQQQETVLRRLRQAASGRAGADGPSGAPGDRFGAVDGDIGAGDHGLAGAGDAVIVALSDACARFPLPVGALAELIEGVRMDVQGASFERFEDLLAYCRRVAGAIGRLCLAVFDARASQSESVQTLADDLGVALQLTNILRDVREDADHGRVYLPREDLRRFGVAVRLGAEPESLRAQLRAPGDAARGGEAAARSRRTEEAGGAGASNVAELMRFEARRAQEWFDRGSELAPLLDRRSAACVRAMAGIYERLLARIAADPQRALAERVALAPWEKAWVAVRSMVARRGPARSALREGTPAGASR